MIKKNLTKILFILILINQVPVLNATHYVDTFLAATKELFMSRPALIIGGALLGLAVGLHSWRACRKKTVRRFGVVDLYPIQAKAAMGKNDKQASDPDLSAREIKADLKEIKNRMRSNSTGDLDDLDASPRSMPADQQEEDQEAYLQMILEETNVLCPENSGQLGQSSCPAWPMIDDKQDVSEQVGPKKRFTPDEASLFGQEQIDQAPKHEAGMAQQDDVAQGNEHAGLSSVPTWPDPELFNGLAKIPLLHEEVINAHLEDLIEKLAIDPGDQDEFRSHAKLLIKLGGRSFYYLLQGLEHKLPYITVPFSQTEEKDSKADLQRRAQLQVIVALIWFLYAQALSFNEKFWEGTFVLSAKYMPADHATGDAMEDESYGEGTRAIKNVYDYLLSYIKKVNGDWQEPGLSSGNIYGYRRISTHWPKLQNEFMQFGIDVDPYTTGEQIFIDHKTKKPSPMYVLPNLQIHILFGRLGAQELFLKPEDSGCCHAKLRGFAKHSFGAVRAAVRKIIGSNDQVGMRKEHLPERLIKKLQENGLTPKGTCSTFKQLWNEFAKREDERATEVKEYMKQWRHPELRWGNEAYFTVEKDVLPGALYYGTYCLRKSDCPEGVIFSDGQTSQSDEDEDNEQELCRALARYAQDGIQGLADSVYDDYKG